jgi:hypothetical protein
MRQMSLGFGADELATDLMMSTERTLDQNHFAASYSKTAGG